jgi:hypothetical protein
MLGPITDEARHDCSIQAYGVIDSMANKNNAGENLGTGAYMGLRELTAVGAIGLIRYQMVSSP